MTRAADRLVRLMLGCPACGYAGPGAVCPVCAVKRRYVRLTPPAAPAPRELAAEDHGGIGTLADLLDAPGPARRLIGHVSLDLALGGGLVAGQVLLLAGDAGAGKTQLALLLAERLAPAPALYVSAEMTLPALAEYVRRTGTGAACHVLMGGDLPAIAHRVDVIRPTLCVVDSLQACHDPDTPGAPGAPGQVVAIADTLARQARALSVTLVLICHVTKDGQRAGPEAVAHLVDTEARLGYDEAAPEGRVFTIRKNRYGPSAASARLVMGAGGFQG